MGGHAAVEPGLEEGGSHQVDVAWGLPAVGLCPLCCRRVYHGTGTCSDPTDTTTHAIPLPPYAGQRWAGGRLAGCGIVSSDITSGVLRASFGAVDDECWTR